MKYFLSNFFAYVSEDSKQNRFGYFVELCKINSILPAFVKRFNITSISNQHFLITPILW